VVFQISRCQPGRSGRVTWRVRGLSEEGVDLMIGYEIWLTDYVFTRGSHIAYSILDIALRSSLLVLRRSYLLTIFL